MDRSDGRDMAESEPSGGWVYPGRTLRDSRPARWRGVSDGDRTCARGFCGRPADTRYRGILCLSGRSPHYVPGHTNGCGPCDDHESVGAILPQPVQSDGHDRLLDCPGRIRAIDDTSRDIIQLLPRRNGSLWVLSSRGEKDVATGTIAVLDEFDGEGRFARQVTLRGAGFRPAVDAFYVLDDFVYVVTNAGEWASELDGDGMTITCSRIARAR